MQVRVTINPIPFPELINYLESKQSGQRSSSLLALVNRTRAGRAERRAVRAAERLTELAGVDPPGALDALDDRRLPGGPGAADIREDSGTVARADAERGQPALVPDPQRFIERHWAVSRGRPAGRDPIPGRRARGRMNGKRGLTGSDDIVLTKINAAIVQRRFPYVRPSAQPAFPFSSAKRY